MSLDHFSWRKSSRSNGQGGNCVEIGTADAAHGIRDTKDRALGALLLDTHTYAAFLSVMREEAERVDS